MPNNLQYLFRLKLKTEKKQSFFFKRHILKKIPTIQQGKKNYSLNVFSIFLESVSKLNEIVSCDDTEAKWTQTGVTFHFGWNFILGDKISCKHYPKWNTYTCPSKKGSFWNAAEMKLHVNGICFHAGLKSQTSMSSFRLSCERTLSFFQPRSFARVWNTHFIIFSFPARDSFPEEIFWSQLSIHSPEYHNIMSTKCKH